MKTCLFRNTTLWFALATMSTSVAFASHHNCQHSCSHHESHHCNAPFADRNVRNLADRAENAMHILVEAIIDVSIAEASMGAACEGGAILDPEILSLIDAINLGPVQQALDQFVRVLNHLNVSQANQNLIRQDLYNFVLQGEQYSAAIACGLVDTVPYFNNWLAAGTALTDHLSLALGYDTLQRNQLQAIFVNPLITLIAEAIQAYNGISVPPAIIGETTAAQAVRFKSEAHVKARQFADFVVRSLAFNANHNACPNHRDDFVVQ